MDAATDVAECFIKPSDRCLCELSMGVLVVGLGSCGCESRSFTYFQMIVSMRYIDTLED